MHEKPSGDAAKQPEGRFVDTVMHHVKYQGINCVSTFSVFVDFLSLEFALPSHIVPRFAVHVFWEFVAGAEFPSSDRLPTRFSDVLLLGSALS
jgi:hypothetical protein